MKRLSEDDLRRARYWAGDMYGFATLEGSKQWMRGLLDEIDARGEELEELLAEVEFVDEENALLADFTVAGRIVVDRLTDENRQLRTQLASADERRTTGGIPRGVTPNWSAVAKLNGHMPPPYKPQSEDQS